jgi:hypothetical protein
MATGVKEDCKPTSATVDLLRLETGSRFRNGSPVTFKVTSVALGLLLRHAPGLMSAYQLQPVGMCACPKLCVKLASDSLTVPDSETTQNAPSQPGTSSVAPAQRLRTDQQHSKQKRIAWPQHTWIQLQVQSCNIMQKRDTNPCFKLSPMMMHMQGHLSKDKCGVHYSKSTQHIVH